MMRVHTNRCDVPERSDSSREPNVYEYSRICERYHYNVTQTSSRISFIYIIVGTCDIAMNKIYIKLLSLYYIYIHLYICTYNCTDACDSVYIPDKYIYMIYIRSYTVYIKYCIYYIIFVVCTYNRTVFLSALNIKYTYKYSRKRNYNDRPFVS